jgi:ABC-type transport system involved in Fe-S cluster assembly fused permease/ATPase subunit
MPPFILIAKILEQGKVVERGTHDELLVMEGAYAQLIAAA